VIFKVRHLCLLALRIVFRGFPDAAKEIDTAVKRVEEGEMEKHYDAVGAGREPSKDGRVDCAARSVKESKNM
jgi:hypothetical protein